ncbi:MAG: hypothetical protein U9Q33_06770 [Campylobacterota bacterium]|nr:hypothetical protein [Campylobacterota bacterium]
MTVNSNIGSIAAQNSSAFKSDKNTSYSDNKNKQEGVSVELSDDVQKYLAKGLSRENHIAQNVNYSDESANFDKSKLSQYSGSYSQSLSHAVQSRVASLIE